MHSRDSELLMKLDFRHSELLAYPIHLSAVHIFRQYGQISNTSNQVNYMLYLEGSCVLLYFMPKTIFYTVRFRLRLQYQNDWLAFCYDSPEGASAVVVRRLFNKTINREKRLSPRGALRRGFHRSLLPHSSGRTKVRLNHSL